MAAQMQTNAFIAGAWLNTTQRFDVRNPATGQVIAKVSDCSVAAMQDAPQIALKPLRHKGLSAIP